MVNRKLKAIILTISFCIVFFIGLFVGAVFSPVEIHHATAFRTAMFFHEQIKNNFGVMTQFDRGKFDVVGGFGWKDISFPIIMENGVKTIRVYRFINE